MSRPRALAGSLALAGALGLLGAAAPANARGGPVAGLIYTVAGDGRAGAASDGATATAAPLALPRGLAATADGGFLVGEATNNDVRRVSARGLVFRAAGTGAAGYAGDGGLATAAELDFVHAISPFGDPGFLVADTLNDRIRRVGADGRIATAAGTGVRGYGGDGGPATLARIDDPRDVAALPGGAFLFPDTGNDRIRRVGADGKITTVAGTGVRGFSGDGGPAIAARLDQPFAVSPTRDGGFLIADTGNDRIRRVSPRGMITTVAGTGVRGYRGDGGRATAARIRPPTNVSALPDGGFLIADYQNARVRRVLPSGRIGTVAGGRGRGFGGDGGPATRATLDEPKDAVPTPDGGILIADGAENRVRFVAPARTRWLAVALGFEARRVPRGATLRVRYATTRAASIRLDLLRGARHVARARRAQRASRGGLESLVLPGQGARGAYLLRIVAITSDGARATDVARLRVV